jgi:DNA helicase-2/ATP-dependent DNA helicase PcrA
MHFTADLHIHSHYAKATSPYLNLETLYQWAIIKGVDVIGTGDFTHPAWFRELKEKLVPEGNGFFLLKDAPKDLPLNMKLAQKKVRFCLSTEINCEAMDKGKLRRVHHLVYAPDFETAEKINKKLSTLCDLAEDGRPTIQQSSRNLLEITLESSPDVLQIQRPRQVHTYVELRCPRYCRVYMVCQKKARPLTASFRGYYLFWE